jgi:hypothetical protein
MLAGQLKYLWRFYCHTFIDCFNSNRSVEYGRKTLLVSSEHCEGEEFPFGMGAEVAA